MIYPKFPSGGDVIGICAPSAGVGAKEELFDMSLEVLHGAGFQTAESESVRSDDCPSASAAARGAEFNEMFDDPDIAMVMSASGGDFNVEMLPYIDQELIKRNPKWFSGYSDPTAIELMLTTKLDIATIYGVNAGAWDWDELHEFQLNALSLLTGKIPVQHSYDLWASHGFDEEEGCYVMDEEVDWTLLVPSGGELTEASELDVTGRLIGGCIDVIDDMIGTPFEDLQGFAERYAGDGLIWFFDNFAMQPMDLMYVMIKMKFMGLFDSARAVIFGRPCFRGEASDIDYLELLERVFAETDVPVIWGADVGHTKPSFTLINGSVAHLRYENGEAVLSMELK